MFNFFNLFLFNRFIFDKISYFLCLLGLLFFSLSAKADIWGSILNEIKAQTKIEDKIRQYASQVPGLQQQTINQLMNTAGLNFASLNFDGNLQSWGEQAKTWDSVRESYNAGGSGIGSLSQKLESEFPIQKSHVANPNPSSLDAKYYTLQAKTALAVRAASELDYNHINQQIDYMHKLLSLINQTKTLKDGIDLQNRIQIEGNLIDLELLRLSALSNQQEAVKMQGRANAIVNNANAFK